MVNLHNNYNIKLRNLTDKMITSHIPMIIPCILWTYTEFNDTYHEQLIDRFMAIILTTTLIFSISYHLYYEQILCLFESRFNIFSILFLNIYMIFKKIHIYYIICSLPILGLLQYMLVISRCFDRNHYEKNHYKCHYIAGLYITYCMYLIRYRETFSNLNYILN